MKTVFLVCFVGLFFLQTPASKCQSVKLIAEKVSKVSDFENLHQSGDFYFGAQPNLNVLNSLKEQGVTTIINLRSTDENKEFAQLAFDEEQIVKSMGFTYVSIPMKGKDGFSIATLSAYSKALEKNSGKVFIHCKKGGRVTLVMMAYLIKHENYTMEQAEKFGEQLTYFNYLNALLGED